MLPLQKKKKRFNRLDDALDVQVQVQITVASLKIKLTRTKKIHGACCSYRNYSDGAMKLGPAFN